MYKGYAEIELTEEEMAEFYKAPLGFDDLLLDENEYLAVCNTKGEILDKYRYQNGKLRPLNITPITNTFMGKIRPRNEEQEFAFDLFNERDTKVKILRGIYGSGKDFIMLNAALQLIEKGKFERIIYIRPNVTVRDVPDIGYLPGDADDKLAWTLGPIADKIGGDEGIEYLKANNRLIIVPLAFIRGRSFDNSIIYMSEGQNITAEIATLLVARVGENSELWINADNHQTDKRVFDVNNGVSAMIECFRGNPLVGYVAMSKTERSEVAELATLLDEYRKEKEKE